MELTFVGLIQLAAGGYIVLAGGMRRAFLFLMLSGLFDGSASIILPALGGTSIAPVQFALLFVFLRILAPRGGFLGYVPDAIRSNRWLVLFTLYSMAGAFIAPRMFAGMIDVFPMRHLHYRSLFDTVPLEPTPQNITASLYALGSLLTAIAAYIACRTRGGAATLVGAAIAIAWFHAASGLLSALTRGTPLDVVFEIFRNGIRTQMDNGIHGFVRIRGVFPETSSYTDFGFAYFVVNAELWYRSIRPKATGAAALALAAILVFSTSSTAYVGMAGYLLFFLLRQFALPAVADPRKTRTVAIVIFGIVLLVAIMAAIAPHMCQAVYEMIRLMTVDKAASASGQQRLFWALQGWHAFTVSYGLGIGSGSFRSSSIFLAILGSTGVIGIVTFLMYLISFLQPWRRSTWGRVDDLAHSLGGALAIAALLTLIAAAINSSEAYAGSNLAIFAGAALALRPRRHAMTEGDAPLTEQETSSNAGPIAAVTALS